MTTSPQPTSFVERMHNNAGNYLITAKEDDIDAWFVVHMSDKEHKALSVRSKCANIRDYCTILASGWGKLDDDLRQVLQEKYQL